MIRAIKGTWDLLPPDTAVWNRVETIARAVFQAYNYHEIRTPILEETQRGTVTAPLVGQGHTPRTFGLDRVTAKPLASQFHIVF